MSYNRRLSDKKKGRIARPFYTSLWLDTLVTDSNTPQFLSWSRDICRLNIRYRSFIYSRYISHTAQPSNQPIIPKERASFITENIHVDISVPKQVLEKTSDYVTRCGPRRRRVEAYAVCAARSSLLPVLWTGRILCSRRRVPHRVWPFGPSWAVAVVGRWVLRAWFR